MKLKIQTIIEVRSMNPIDKREELHWKTGEKMTNTIHESRRNMSWAPCRCFFEKAKCGG